jgi:hypothetical protein
MAEDARPKRPNINLRPDIPIAISVAALLIVTIQQTSSLTQARGQLVTALSQQDAPYREAVALRDRLDAIAQDTELAASGDPAAKAIIDALRQQGIALPPPRKPIDPGVDRVGRFETKNPGKIERVAANDAFDAVHDPGHVADAADDLCRGIQPHQRREFTAPGAIGVEHESVRMNGVIVGGEDAAQELHLLRLVKEYSGLVAPACGALHRHEEGSHRTRYAGMKTRILPQDCGKQSRTGTR